jgi:hypothetical protein
MRDLQALPFEVHDALVDHHPQRFTDLQPDVQPNCAAVSIGQAPQKQCSARECMQMMHNMWTCCVAARHADEGVFEGIVLARNFEGTGARESG